jgi:N-acetylneuraminate synthase
MSFNISGRKVGDIYDPLVIVEIGINHEGSLDVAKVMVDAAVSAGAEIIKHQTHIVEDEMSDDARLVIPGNTDVSIYEVMERCALSEEDEYELMNYVVAKGAIFISTPFSKKSVDRLVKFDVPAFKVGSGECNNFPLLKYIASFGKPMIVSTGMNTLESVKIASEILENAGVDYAFLHTTNLYPTPPELVRLGAMQKLMCEFPNVEIGLSDHTTSNHACFAAVALGATILERHFTDNLDRPGPDIVNSMDPNALNELINGSGLIAKMRGGEKQPAKEEQVTMAFAFASVVATSDIAKGDLITQDNIWLKRPGGGDFGASDYDSLIGLEVKHSVKSGTQIKRSHLSVIIN